MGIGPRFFSISALAALAALVSCRDKPKPPAPPASPSASVAGPSSAAPAAPTARSEERDEKLDAAVAVADGGSFKLGELSDVGPAGPASASSRGVVMVSRDDDIVLARLPSKGPFKSVELDAGAFAQSARGPAIAGEFAYWISKQRLVRKKIEGGPLEVLAEGATDGTRAAAVTGAEGRPAAAAYLGPSKSGEDLVAMIWIEGGDIQRLSPSGSAASSVALAALGNSLIAVYLEGRTGMTPVHARKLGFSDGKAKLDEDVVIWVAGPAQPSTEIVTGSAAADSWAFVPLERDTTRFGLAELRVGEKPAMDIPVIWRGYPNGMSPAPIAATDACGGTLVAYVRPADEKPGATQELHVAPLASDGLGPSEVAARSRQFTNISLAALSDGVLLSYVGDHRTWATRASCTTKK